MLKNMKISMSHTVSSERTCLSVCLSVNPSASVCNVGGSGSHKLEILETNCTDNYPNTFALPKSKPVHLLPGEMGKFWAA